MTYNINDPDVQKAISYLEDIKDLKKSDERGTKETDDLIVDDSVYHTAIRSHVKHFLEGNNKSDEIAWEIFLDWDKKRREARNAGTHETDRLRG
jgi:hypothetical protein